MKSILFSLLQTLLKLDFTDALSEIRQGGRGIFLALWYRKRTRVLADLRSYHCKQCPFYDARWQTCGTPGEVHPAIDLGDVYFPTTKIGCWCYTPLANHNPVKDCYARANELDVGWPDALRPK